MLSPFAASATLPDYLKVQLQVGESEQWPLLTALDETLERLGTHALARALDLVSETTSYSRRELELRALGWQIDALTSAAREQLYNERHQILEARGTLLAVEILAKIYFRGAEVSLGRPFAPSRLGQSANVTLVDRSDRRRVVFVRTRAVCQYELREEFRLNSRLLLPHPFTVLVGAPRKPPTTVEKVSLATPRCWDLRRVPCLISRK